MKLILISVNDKYNELMDEKDGFWMYVWKLLITKLFVILDANYQFKCW
jgi:hypothetical protein